MKTAWTPNVPVGALLAISAICGLFAALMIPLSLGRVSPAEFNPAWLFAWAMALASVGAALLASRNTRSAAVRIVAFLCMALALFGAAFTFENYLGNYGDYPWAVVWLLLILTVGGGFASRQRLAAVGVLIFVVAWLRDGFQPAELRFPVVREQDGLTFRLQNPVQNRGGVIVNQSITLKVQGPEGRDLRKEFDLDHIEVEGRINRISFPCRGYSPELEMPSNQIVIALRTYCPPWPRNWNLTVEIPRFKGAATVVEFPRLANPD